MFRWILVAAVLTAGCVTKKTHTELVDSAAAKEASLLARVTVLEESLTNAEQTNESLEALTATLEARSAKQNEQLEELSGRIANLSSLNRNQRTEKAELETLLGKVREEAETAEAKAEAQRERADALAEERARLAAEKAKLEEKTAEYDALVDELESEIEAGEVTITELSGKLTVNVSDRILFASGKAALKPQGVEALTRVAAILAGVADREIRVEGHTDNVPVSANAPYPDNWALSSLRASHVVALLVKEGVAPLNIASVGYGEHRPAAPNDTSDGRALNRRIEIVLVPRLTDQPGATPADEPIE